MTFNTLRYRQNGRYVPDDIFKDIFFNENSIKMLLKFVSKDPTDNKSELGQVMVTYTNADLVLPRMYAALRGDELNAAL